MSIHKNLTQPEAIHPFAYASNANPASDSSAGVAAYKGWLDTSTSPATLKVRNAGNTDWDGIQVQAAGVASFASNSNDVGTASAGGASTSLSRADHVHRGVSSVAHSSNTFYGPITLTTPGNTVGISSPTPGTLALTAVGAAGGGGSGTLSTSFSAVLSGDVTMTTAGTFYDGPSQSCVAGTWLFIYHVAFTLASSLITDYVARLWDGTTTYDEAGNVAPALATTHCLVAGCAIVVLGSTTTVKISGTADRNAQTMSRNLSVVAGPTYNSNTATRLIGIKIA